MKGQFQELFATIGKAWDLTFYNKEDALHIITEIKEFIQTNEKQTIDNERKGILEELCDITIQLNQQQESINNSSIDDDISTEERYSLSISKRQTPSKESTENGYQSNSKRFRSTASVTSSVSTPSSERQSNAMDQITWQDIIGQDDAKRALYECCILPTLLPHSLFIGSRQLSTSVLLYGPPGTGKTTLVHAVANESHYYLLELTPSSCLSKWAGEAERRIQSFFNEAKKRAPCILFLDEFDALALKRESAEDAGARRVLSELLIQFSSIHSHDRVIIVASTNRITDLDPAIIRRFQKTIEVPLPSLDDRKRIIKKGLQGISNQLTENELHYLAQSTEGWSGSLLQNMTREASMIPVLEMAQVILSSTQEITFDLSITSSHGVTPSSSDTNEIVDNSNEKTKKEGILEIRPVQINDFIEALTTLQDRSVLEGKHEDINTK